jgi:tRNA dimethylallyltransferase
LVSEDLTAILVICGPTGSGKGQLAREIARRVPGEVISADSRKIYRGFDIGTAKAPPDARREIPHHLVDVCDPDEVFTAGIFADQADAAIREIRARGKLPIVAGGTGLYIRALLFGIVDAPPRDEALRQDYLDREARDPGCLHRRLAEVDPRAADQIPTGDLARIVRALEVFDQTGQKLSDLQAAHGFQKSRYRYIRVAPDWSREDLHERINQRVLRMMQAGWLDEVRRLREQGLSDCPAFQSVGYRQLNDHLQGKLSMEEAVQSIQAEHRRYAKRQLVWFRAIGDIRWLSTPVDVGELLSKVRGFLDG